MKIIISPAKKMREDTDSLAWRDLPQLLDKTRVILDTLKQMTPQQRQALWACNDQIAAQNNQRLERMNLVQNLTPAILCYEGIQYQRMAPGVFTGEELEYVQEHLRILSGFYGILRPLDGVTPYRLEMQAKLQVGQAADLYAYWGSALAQALEEDQWVVNLASKEYSQCIARYLDPQVKMVTCLFGEEQKGKIREKATLCKMARGEMVRFMAERQVQQAEELYSFDRLGFRYASEFSQPDTLVFLRDNEEKGKK